MTTKLQAAAEEIAARLIEANRLQREKTTAMVQALLNPKGQAK